MPSRAYSAGPIIMTYLRLPAMLALKGTHRFGFATFAISLLIVSPIAFHSKSPLVFYRFDGIYLLITTVMQKTWSVSNWYFTSNHIDGIGGFELAQQNDMHPGTWCILHWHPTIGPTALSPFYAALLAVSMGGGSSRLGMA